MVTEFERKVYEEAEKMDLSGTDEETAKIFREIYLPYSKKVFNSLGQTPEEVAEACFYFSLNLTMHSEEVSLVLNNICCFFFFLI